jgi:decaprenylphospho-beta-D-ribofuranose 2-oxidase
MPRISGWGRYPVADSELRTPSNREGARAVMRDADTVIARGNGRSYGDASIGVGMTLSMLGLDRMVQFDPCTALLRVEAGVLLSDVLATFLPLGFFPAVVPGTQYVTIGGAIAADVHGKNHHKEGGFGDHVLQLVLTTGSGEIVSASREENSELFWATVGGMGLTGTILEATIRLRRIETGWIRQTTVVADDLAAAMATLKAAADVTYTVAWIDCVAKGSRLGRSLIFLGEHASRKDLEAEQAKNPFPLPGDPKLFVPFDFPGFALNHFHLATFNEAYFRVNARKAGASCMAPVGRYFFPLDGIAAWNRIYGRRGFVQHQCVIPDATAASAIAEMLDRIARRGGASFLAVLKKLGRSRGSLSFPIEGYTLALDFPFSPSLLGFLDDLDRIVVDAGGRLYLAKDARQSRKTFDAGYQNADRFRQFRRLLDGSGKVRSHLSDRLGL